MHGLCAMSQRDARASLKVAFLRFSTNVEYGYIYANRTCFLCFCITIHSLT